MFLIAAYLRITRFCNRSTSAILFAAVLLLVTPSVTAQSQSPAEFIRSLATEFGPFDQRLLEPVADQGLQLQERGQHRNAIQLLEHAFLLSRMVHGLYSEQQIELLDMLIESEIAIEDWERVDNHYAYMEQLYRRLYDEYDIRLEHGLQKIVAWHVNALEFNLDGRREYHLRATNTLFKARLRVAENLLDQDDPKFAYLHEGIQLSAQQLRLYSGIYRARLEDTARRNRDTLIADLD